MKNQFLARVFRWFGLGLLITFITAYFTSTSPIMLAFIFGTPAYIFILIAEVVLAIWLSSRIRKMNSTLTSILYIVYTILSGLTFASIFILYEIESIIYVFLATSIIVLIFSILGKNSRIDLSKFKTLLFVALLSILILGLINYFIMNNTLDIFLCVIGTIIFVGYIYYDVNKIVNLYDESDNIAIIGAFNLYLDFINIFIRLLKLFGKERN